ncbi:S-methyl-5-thioribose kinase [Acidisoma cellulosilytica]|uniref:S-methyl-5-thioribose kinase n=1 Tax=Acidisoma cellulosilyticum TaxID=2802395 RepID=A0A964E4T7_9PROT|nr:S-methyl-5-thioribose kinase [Acidisoma cellulosilyticum]MCB8881985.1 S-methyl-5-thioribose kinase [Acidisoma cellulosilyticum]
MLDNPNSDYRILTLADLPAYLAGLPDIAAMLGGGTADWRCEDVADGNLNSVFLVDGPAGGLCVKQALPYVRVAGESWPMDVRRAFFEVSYARRMAPFVGSLAPAIHHFDAAQFIIVMEKLAPHIILRSALIAGAHHPRVPVDVADYIAAASFHTSDLAAPFETKAADQALFAGNIGLQRISVDLVFTDPYVIHERNRVTVPLAGWAAAFRADIDLKEAVTRARLAYLTHAQSLLHGDLHSGSIMVTATETRVIDGEFALIGPSGFDIGNFIAHYVMAWFAKPFHGSGPAETARFRDLLAADILVFWQRFEAQFLAHWRGFAGAADGLPASHFADPVAAARAETMRRSYVADLFRDAVMFMACKIIRRVLGFAQIADFLVIPDEVVRAQAQAAALAFARSVLLHPARYGDIAAVVAAMPRFEGAGLDPAPTRLL